MVSIFLLIQMRWLLPSLLLSPERLPLLPYLISSFLARNTHSKYLFAVEGLWFISWSKCSLNFITDSDDLLISTTISLYCFWIRPKFEIYLASGEILFSSYLCIIFLILFDILPLFPPYKSMKNHTFYYKIIYVVVVYNVNFFVFSYFDILVFFTFSLLTFSTLKSLKGTDVIASGASRR